MRLLVKLLKTWREDLSFDKYFFEVVDMTVISIFFASFVANTCEQDACQLHKALDKNYEQNIILKYRPHYNIYSLYV